MEKSVKKDGARKSAPNKKNYSLEQLSDEVAKIVGKKSIKFSTETVKVIEDTFTKTKEEDRSIKAYDHLFQK